MLVRRGFSLVSVLAVSISFGLMTIGQAAAQDVRRLCSEKYQAAKAAGTLGSDTWPQFYSKCTAEAKGNAAAEESAAAPPPLDTRRICSEKYQAAKAAGTLSGETWPQFYSRCTAETKANPPAAAEVPAPAVSPPVAAAPPPAVEAPPPPVVAAPADEAPPPPVVAAPAVEAPPPPVVAAPVAEPPAPPAAAAAASAPANPLKKAPAPKPMAPAMAAAPSTAIFPSAISPSYAKETPYKGRLKTCSDQFKANKATNANGGLKWIQKGGGYWSECNKRLKG